MQKLNQTNIRFGCVNCKKELCYLPTSDDDHILYCPRIDCSYASIYSDEYLAALDHYKKYKENIGGFAFIDDDEENSKSELEQSRIEQPKEYKLELNNVYGMKSVKRQLKRVVNVKGEKKIHCLIISQPGQSKTHILKCMEKELSEQNLKVKYIDSINASKSGILGILFDSKEEYNIIQTDELDKLSADQQYGLLSLAENGFIQQTTARHKRQKKINATIIATANRIDRIVQPLLTRFLVLYLKPYTQNEFISICTEMLIKKFHYINPELGKYIAHKTLEYKRNNSNMRDSVRMALLVQSNPCFEEVDHIVQDLKLNDVPECVADKLEIEV